MSDILVDSKTILAGLGIAKSTLSKYRNLGLPVAGPNQYFIGQVVQWFIDNIIAAKNECSEPSELTQARTIYWKNKAELMLVQAERARGLVVDREEMHVQWGNRIAEIAHAMELLKDRLPPVLVGKNQIEISALIEDEIYAMRSSFARTGEYCPPPSPAPSINRRYWMQEDIEKWQQETVKKESHPEQSGRKSSVKPGARKNPKSGKKRRSKRPVVKRSTPSEG